MTPPAGQLPGPPPPGSPATDFYHPNLLRGSSFDNEIVRIHRDIAKDESLDDTIYAITKARCTMVAKQRLASVAAWAQSNNPVFTNLINSEDYLAAEDDFKYALMMSEVGLTTYDLGKGDFMAIAANMEANFCLRLRRGREALNLKEIGTVRFGGPSASIPEHAPAKGGGILDWLRG